MPRFGKASLENLGTCDNRLREICLEAIKIMDFSVICGHRGEEAQNKAFTEGNSKAKWGESKHNSMPSKAIDLLPYPPDWADRERFAKLAGIMVGIAHMKGIKIKWGGEFKGFYDAAHFQLVN